ncbi:MAG: hypothetical protein BWX86_01600 [Verrucomicrobia bacterium ADurb.Bin122]|nr:MAG: hypothetical protein BWX86_01600 [Verrucomicrobia bacterium ADurb.Bin122]
MSASDFASGLADNSASTDTGRSIAPSGRPAFTSEGRVSRSIRRACMPALASTRRLTGSSFHSTSMGTRSSPMRKTAVVTSRSSPTCARSSAYGVTNGWMLGPRRGIKSAAYQSESSISKRAAVVDGPVALRMDCAERRSMRASPSRARPLTRLRRSMERCLELSSMRPLSAKLDMGKGWASHWALAPCGRRCPGPATMLQVASSR